MRIFYFLEEKTKFYMVCKEASARANRKLHVSQVEDLKSIYDM